MQAARKVAVRRGEANSRRANTRRRLLCRTERQRLLVDNLPEVRQIARRIHVRLPPQVPFEDLVHSGVLGLMDAVEKFDARKNVPLRSYARLRIRGAILDSLRELDGSSRGARQQARRVEKARVDLMGVLGRAPSEMEMAAHLDLRLADFQQILAKLSWLSIAACGREDYLIREQERGELRSTSKIEDPFQVCARLEVTKLLGEAIAALDAKERQALKLYYFEERTMKEVAGALHVHESRVSQMVTASLHRLRVRLQGPLNERGRGIGRALAVPS